MKQKQIKTNEYNKIMDALNFIDEPEASIDFHGLGYWATRVEDLRQLIKNSL